MEFDLETSVTEGFFPLNPIVLDYLPKSDEVEAKKKSVYSVN